MRPHLHSLSLLILLLGAASLAEAATHHVRPGESIQSAVDAAASDDLILVHAGVYVEQVFIAQKDLTLRGQGDVILRPASLSVHPGPPTFFSDVRSVIGIEQAEVTIESVVIDGAAAAAGGGPGLAGIFFIRSRGAVRRSGFFGLADPSTMEGAGILAEDSDVSVRGCQFEGFGSKAAHHVLGGSVEFSHNTVQGDGLRILDSGEQPQSGLVISLETSGRVAHNTFLDLRLEVRSTSFGFGAIVGQVPGPLVIRNNRILRATNALALFFAEGADIAHNRLEEVDIGLLATATTGGTIEGNRVSASPAPTLESQLGLAPGGFEWLLEKNHVLGFGTCLALTSAFDSTARLNHLIDCETTVDSGPSNTLEKNHIR